MGKKSDFEIEEIVLQRFVYTYYSATIAKILNLKIVFLLVLLFFWIQFNCGWENMNDKMKEQIDEFAAVETSNVCQELRCLKRTN